MSMWTGYEGGEEGFIREEAQSGEDGELHDGVCLQVWMLLLR